MSYFMSNADVLTRTLWSPLLTERLPAITPPSVFADWQRVPHDYDGLCSWMLVNRTDEGVRATHPYVLLYSPTVCPVKGEDVRVVLRFHGVVESLNISPTGNYNGRKEAAPRAVQFLSLTGSSWNLPFDDQRRSLENIRAYVGTVLNCTVEDTTRRPGTIYFQRLVFTKVRRDAPSAVKSALVYGDDPHGWASAIQNDWVVGHKIFTALYDEQGKPTKKPYTIIRVGDFVEVSASVDIIKYRKRSGWATEARLSVQQVIRVADKATVEMAHPPPPSNRVVTDQQAAAHIFALVGTASVQQDDPNAMQT
ncbi:uncharacterized protein TRAVEDRAFT_47612 [Trametes versicolor FP-101664 SS1]|uniref:uncharacterized protein n=1 Tax=Trametes versicolor (strain FP-101664) TaxID=717944 RepID=UPI0004621EC5|nr:uncharacterized protein TRAVEDRAFT_47612 [Trametes versicolor FP-101664 SS1]EIW58456.1 hypothetical protein TRAVEDRAFT_47612 [Trametes versicolor FP-101664 SS1]